MSANSQFPREESSPSRENFWNEDQPDFTEEAENAAISVGRARGGALPRRDLAKVNGAG